MLFKAPTDNTLVLLTETAKNREQQSKVAPLAVMLFGLNGPKRNIIFRRATFMLACWVCHTRTRLEVELDGFIWLLCAAVATAAGKGVVADCS